MRGYAAASGLGSVLSTRYLWSRESWERFVPSASSLPMSHSREDEESRVGSSWLTEEPTLYFYCGNYEICCKLATVSLPEPLLLAAVDPDGSEGWRLGNVEHALAGVQSDVVSNVMITLVLLLMLIFTCIAYLVCFFSRRMK